MTRASRAKLYPEIDLPPKIIDLVKAYVGPRRMAKLSTNQRGKLSEIANGTAQAVALVLNGGDGDA